MDPKLRVLIIFAIIITISGINNGKGVGGRIGGFGVGGGGGGFSGGGRHGFSGGGGGFHIRSRWWLLGAGGLYGGYRTREMFNDKSNSTGGGLDELTTEENFVAIWGFIYSILWFGSLISKFIKPGRYNQSKFSGMYFLAFLSLSVFTAIAYNIRTGESTDEIENNEVAAESWVNWFDPEVTNFIKFGGSPLNYFDIFYCAAGMGISALLVIKDACLSEGPLQISILTKVTSVWFGLVLIIGAVIGQTSSWKIPMVLFTMAAILIAFMRYVGLMFAHYNEHNSGIWTEKRRQKYKQFEMLELFTGIFSIIFHVTLSDAYGDWTIAFINSGFLTFAILAVVFSPIFLIILYLTPRRSPDDLYADENGEISGAPGIIMCHKSAEDGDHWSQQQKQSIT